MVEKWGTHPSWSRLLGSPVLFGQIEERLTDLLGCEDTLILPTITHIHMSVIPVLAAGGTVFMDSRAHKTIYDGCQFAAARGATLKRFRFEDPDDLERLLVEDRSDRKLVCMDGVNSITGNAPDLAAFARVTRRHGALLYVDDAHGFGVIGERSPRQLCPYGNRGNSIVRHLGESYEGIVLVGGFSKAYSSLAAFIACPTALKEMLKTAAAALPVLGPAAGGVACDHAGRLRGERPPRRRAAPRALRAHGPRASGPEPARRAHAQPLRLPDHRGPPRRPPRHRRGRPVPVRQRHLRHPGRLPARAQGGGRLPHPGHRRQRRRRDRRADRRPRRALAAVRAAAGGRRSGRRHEPSADRRSQRALAAVRAHRLAVVSAGGLAR